VTPVTCSPLVVESSSVGTVLLFCGLWGIDVFERGPMCKLYPSLWIILFHDRRRVILWKGRFIPDGHLRKFTGKMEVLVFGKKVLWIFAISIDAGQGKEWLRF